MFGYARRVAGFGLPTRVTVENQIPKVVTFAVNMGAYYSSTLVGKGVEAISSYDGYVTAWYNCDDANLSGAFLDSLDSLTQ